MANSVKDKIVYPYIEFGRIMLNKSTQLPGLTMTLVVEDTTSIKAGSDFDKSTTLYIVYPDATGRFSITSVSNVRTASKTLSNMISRVNNKTSAIQFADNFEWYDSDTASMVNADNILEYTAKSDVIKGRIVRDIVSYLSEKINNTLNADMEMDYTLYNYEYGINANSLCYLAMNSLNLVLARAEELEADEEE